MNAGASHRLGVLLVAGAALWWSTGGLFIRSVHTDPWTTIFWRSIFAAATMFLFIAIRKGGQTVAQFREIGWPGVVMALCFCGASSSYVPAVMLTSVANTLILQSLSPFVAALLAFIAMRERVNVRTWIAMVVSFLGVYLMVARSIAAGSYLGNLLGFGIALFYAGAVVITRYRRQVQMLPASCLAAIFGMLLSASVLAFQHRVPWPLPTSELVWLAAFGGLQMAGGMIMFTYGARLIPAAESALLSIIESIGAPIWVFFIFGEDPGIRAIVGGYIVLSAVTIYTALDLVRPEEA
jgi:drug/metabolite transporter (DMT)-like permease